MPKILNLRSGREVGELVWYVCWRNHTAGVLCAVLAHANLLSTFHSSGQCCFSPGVSLPLLLGYSTLPTLQRILRGPGAEGCFERDIVTRVCWLLYCTAAAVAVVGCCVVVLLCCWYPVMHPICHNYSIQDTVRFTATSISGRRVVPSVAPSKSNTRYVTKTLRVCVVLLV